MSFEQWKFLIGTAAAICTTMAFVPQILKIRRSGGRDLSYPMLSLYLGGVLLWLGYGLMIRAQAIILANAAASLTRAKANGEIANANGSVSAAGVAKPGATQAAWEPTENRGATLTVAQKVTSLLTIGFARASANT